MATIEVNCKTYVVIADNGVRESTEEEAGLILKEMENLLKIHPSWPEDFTTIKIAANRYNMEIIEIKKVKTQCLQDLLNLQLN